MTIKLARKCANAILVTATLVSCPGTTLAAEGRWTSGSGQGNLEYFTDSKGWRLHISCPTKDGSADSMSSVSLVFLASDKPARSFKVQAGGNEYAGPFEANSRVGTNNFLSLLNDLRKGDATVVSGNTRLIFPRSNVAAVVPVYGKGFPCNAD